MRTTVDAVRGTGYPVISAGEGMQQMQEELARPWSIQQEMRLGEVPLEAAQRVTYPKRAPPPNKPPLPARGAPLAALLRTAGVVCPARTKVVEKQRLALLADPSLAERYTIPDLVIAAAGAATGGANSLWSVPEPLPEAPPAIIEEVN